MSTTDKAATKHRSGARSTGSKSSAKRGASNDFTVLPQVSLLPPELVGSGRQRTIRRRLVAGVIVAAVVTVAGVAGSAALMLASNTRVAVNTAAGQTLSTQELRYMSVQRLDAQIALAKAADRVGSSTAIDWQQQLGTITAAMPAGFAITAVSTDSATPIADYGQGATPLDVPRAATVTITTVSRSIQALPAWLAELQTMPDYAGATPVISSEGEGQFTVVITIHLNTKAYITPLTGATR